ncbi:hypothetical protein ASG53_11865 [Sanguibacter sp. Leaf3]|nr:hypothetical protein ASG53_11865 [Sanguibacter sp. Leaf3]
MTSTPASAPPARLSAAHRTLAVMTWIGGVLAVLALASVPFRDPLFRGLAGAAEGSPLEPAVMLTAKYGLLVLVALVGVVGLRALVQDRPALWTLVTAGVGVVTTYALSEGIKLLVEEDRPCSVHDLATVLACPGQGDWSWPSNHATLAGAAATAVVLTVPRLLVVAGPVALLVASARVAAGVHYAHDVLAGLALGSLVVVLAVVVGRGVRGRLALATATDPH